MVRSSSACSRPNKVERQNVPPDRPPTSCLPGVTTLRSFTHQPRIGSRSIFSRHVTEPVYFLVELSHIIRRRQNNSISNRSNSSNFSNDVNAWRETKTNYVIAEERTRWKARIFLPARESIPSRRRNSVRGGGARGKKAPRRAQQGPARFVADIVANGCAVTGPHSTEPRMRDATHSIVFYILPGRFSPPRYS